jgi:hypothetical protein
LVDHRAQLRDAFGDELQEPLSVLAELLHGHLPEVERKWRANQDVAHLSLTGHVAQLRLPCKVLQSQDELVHSETLDQRFERHAPAIGKLAVSPSRVGARPAL